MDHSIGEIFANVTIWSLDHFDFTVQLIVAESFGKMLVNEPTRLQDYGSNKELKVNVRRRSLSKS